MLYPKLKDTNKHRLTTDVFRGYNHNLRVDDGEFYAMRNMTSDYYPLLSPRRKRGINTAPISNNENIKYIGSDGARLYWIQNNTLMYNDGTKSAFEGELTGDKHNIVLMGAYLLVFPEKKYVNTETSETGNIEALWSADGATVTFSLTNIGGDEYENVTVQDTAPESPVNGAIWLDTSSEPASLKKYSTSQGKWITIVSTYIKISATGIGNQFEVGDGVAIEGVQADQLQELNNKMIIQDKGDDYIVVIGIIDSVITQDTATHNITVKRGMPTSINYDCIFESNNRLWTCQASDVPGINSTEIYASKLGDFKNWDVFQGISTDSYAVSTGSMGEFTGGIEYNGSPTFFKHNVMFRVYGAMPSEYQLTTTSVIGCAYPKSLKHYNGALFYQGVDGNIYLYNGSLPTKISTALNVVNARDGVAEVYNNKYYISFAEQEGHHLFAYDINRQLWHREDDTQVLGFALCNVAKLAYLDATNKVKSVVASGQDELESEVDWHVETGLLSERTQAKYISKLNVRMSLDVNSIVMMSIEYDSSGVWEHICTLQGYKLTPFVIPVQIHRCDHFRFKIQGKGNAKIYSITRTISEGSDW